MAGRIALSLICVLFGCQTLLAQDAALAKDGASKKLQLAQPTAKEPPVVVRQPVINKAAGKTAVGRVLAPGAAGFGAGIGYRADADPQDPIERFLLLTPGGPLVVQVAITIDGKPFRMKREELIDKLLLAADTDGDGKPTWEEALSTPRFTLGRLNVASDQQRKAYAKTWDKNKNGEVDRTEARAFVAQTYRSPAFSLVGGIATGGYARGGLVVAPNGRVGSGGAASDVLRLLDEDNDGQVSAKEIENAGERLKSRDADDNDLLYSNEISASATFRTLQVQRNRRPARQQIAVPLGSSVKPETLFAIIRGLYKDKDGNVVKSSFSAIPSLFDKLDANTDGILDQQEVSVLNDMPPHIELAIAFGESEGPKGISVKMLAPELSKSAPQPGNGKGAGNSASVEVPGVKMTFVANVAQPRVFNYANTAKSYLTRFDKDSNGYLQVDELPANLARQFKNWDGDGDGKVFEKDITESYTRMLAPQQTQIRAIVLQQRNSVFQALDLSGDGRLSLREMRTASEQLKELDDNQDGRITSSEIPAALTIRFGRGGTSYYAPRPVAVGRRPASAAPAPSRDQPEWFTRMDRNGDGDLTLKEFLGGKTKFAELDTNQDGFIEPKEAKAAGDSK